MSRLLAVTVLVTAAAATAGAQDAENPFTDGPDRRMGETSFRVHCTLCHGYDAQGGAETNGPDLTTGRFRRTSTLAGLFDVIRNGVPGTAMLGINPDVSDRVVWQIITYLDSLTPNLADADLRGDALADPDELRADLLDPSAEVEPRWWTMTVMRADGSVVEGLRMNEDTFTLRLIDADEQLWAFSKGRLRSFDRVRTSSMPAAGGTLTDAEVDDLIAYLFSLRKES